MQTETKNCQNCKKDFTVEPEDFDFYKKMEVPAPTWCWRCRAMRRMCTYNMRFLYERICPATDKKFFSLVPPTAPMPVYSHAYWASDKWDAMDYGRDYDFTRPFFEQIKDLFSAVPWGVVWSVEQVNSDYSVIAYSKNCYLCFDSGYDEDSAYSVTLQRSKACFDTINCFKCDSCYYSINTNESYKTFFSRNCSSCSEVWFSQDCVGCTNSFGCSGLRNKSYHIFNEPYSKEEYHELLAAMRLDSWEGIQKAREEVGRFWQSSVVKYQHGVQAAGCLGDYLYNGTELVSCFFVGNAQNMKHCQSVIFGPNQDGMDVTSSEETRLAYETSCCGGGGAGVHNSIGNMGGMAINECSYTINCRQLSSSFGCVSLKNKKYCILNKQYTKEEYEALIPKIKKHMEEMLYVDSSGRTYAFGDFFPPDMSPFGYSQTQAAEYFPLTEQEASAQGFQWMNPVRKEYAVTKSSHELPDGIKEASDEVLKEVFKCQHHEDNGHGSHCGTDCTRAFRLTAQELSFYRQMNLPLPRLCFNCRHLDRVNWRNVPALYHRQCMCHKKHPQHEGKCANQFETSYAPDRPEIVYCESCYNAEVA